MAVQLLQALQHPQSGVPLALGWPPWWSEAANTIAYS